MKHLIILASTCAALLPAAHAGDAEQLVAMVNAWRAAPATCQARQRPALPVLTPRTALSRIALRPGTILLAALDSAGYDPEVADAVNVEGPTDARSAFDALRESYCATLGSTRYRDIGAHRSGNEWTIVLAAPTPNPVTLVPDTAEAAREVFKATNAARAEARQCGETWMEAAPPLAWNKDLAAAALAHSQDMAQQGYFAHKNKQGNEVPQRAEAQGYRWRHIGENISRGQTSAQEAVTGWINSPGHCYNLMNARFTEFGAGVAIRQGKRPAAFWTQVFGTPR